MFPSVLPRLATDSAVSISWCLESSLFLRLPSHDRTPFPGWRSLPTSLVSVFVFYIFPTCFWRQWSAFMGAWCPLPAFRSCFVEFTQCWNVLLINLWGRKWSPCPILCHLRTAPISMLFNMLFRLIITFFPRNKCLLISWLQSPSAVILEPPKIKSTSVSTVSLSICHEVMGLDAMIFVFWILSFKPAFSLSSFTFIKRCNSILTKRTTIWSVSKVS